MEGGDEAEPMRHIFYVISFPYIKTTVLLRAPKYLHSFRNY